MAEAVERAATDRPPRRNLAPIAALVSLVAVLVIAAGLAAWFRGAANQLWDSGSAQNTALVDVGTTAQVAGQVGDALETVYSYDFSRLDENERAARQVITGKFAEDFGEQFGQVRELAPPQQAVATATVASAAVKVLDGDRATVVVFLDQATRSVDAGQLVAAGRLTVTAERVDGRWKIADVNSK